MTCGHPRVAVSAATALTTDALASGLRAHGLDVVCVEPDRGRLSSALAVAGPVEVIVMSARAVLGERRVDLAGLPAAVLVVGDDRDEQLEQAVRLGAAGYVAWSHSLASVADAVRRVADGEALVPPGMLGGLLRRLIERNRVADDVMVRLTHLSSREREVLALLCDGCTHDEITQQLVVSPQTVRSHVARVLSKLDVHSRAEAVALITDHGLRATLDAMEVPT